MEYMEYLVFITEKWEIAHAAAISMHDDKGIRLAWFRRDGSFICFDYEEPVVRELPDPNG